MTLSERTRERADKASVLVVDDTAAMAELYSRILEAEGFVVRKARSGREALVVLESFQPDLIVLDAMMPEMSGHDLLQRVRAREETANVPVVFLTAAGDDEELIGRAFALGANDYLTKPINRKILSERVRSVIAQARQRALLRAAAGEREEHGRLREEFARARTVQQANLPQTPATRASYRIVGALRPCHDVGGDVFDIIDDADGSATLAVVDVSGHGMSAAMVANAVRGILRLLVGTMPIDLAMSELNQQLCASEKEHYACVALVRLEHSQVHIVNAGLPPIAVLHDNGTEYVSAGGIPPGLVDGATYEKHTIELAKARRIVIATDGVTEPFGLADRTDRLVAEMHLAARGEPPSREQLESDLANLFVRHDIVPPDDATVLILDRLP